MLKFVTDLIVINNFVSHIIKSKEDTEEVKTHAITFNE